MAETFTTQRRVEFCETDAAGIAHFSALMCYMEQAEHGLLRELGLSVVQDIGDGWHLSWPRVRVECDYLGVARFEDELQIETHVARLGEKSVTYSITLSLDGKPIAKGKTVAVCCKVRVGSELQSTPIPSDLATKLSRYLASEPA